MASQNTGNRERHLVELELLGISQRYDNLWVIRDLSLEVYSGELCCLLGPSGCGKTTTLRIIAGFLEPQEGSVRLDGVDITRTPPQRRNVGMVFQNYALFPHMTVYENVAYGLRRRRWSESKIRNEVTEMLRLAHLTGYEDRAVHQLSGGQQQRVALSRALIIRPKLLLLDEPLSNLDARLRAAMREEIRRVQRTLGITAVYVTHDQEEAMSIADRIVVINAGRIEQVGTPQQVYEHPATQFVASFIGRVNLLPGQIVDGALHLLGRTYPSAADDWPTDDFTVCAVRPERVRLTHAEDAPLVGTVQEVTFLGPIVRYQVALDGDVAVGVEAPSPETIHAPGERVGVEIAANDILLFPKST
jgi:ABC-type Fe3+/spermidine/putrescine transport system ATPase subunit